MKLVHAVCGLLLGVLVSSNADAASQYLVLGVIVNSTPAKSVVLVKQSGTEKAMAIRMGQKIDSDTQVVGIHRRSVDLMIGTEKLTVGVGENTSDASVSRYIAQPVMTESNGVGYAGVEREGTTTRVSAVVRDHILKNDLSKVLMQAAAVPQYRNGMLSGFSLHDIEPGSVYEQIGLREGDLVTHINGQGLNDVANTIKLLKSLKDEPNASMNLIRNGQEQTLSLVVQ